MLTETKTPYEFLVRWNQNGEIAGAHVGFYDTVLRDGVIIAQTTSNVESVAIGLQEGFPLSDVLDQTLIDALLLIEVLKAEILALKNPIVENV